VIFDYGQHLHADGTWSRERAERGINGMFVVEPAGSSSHQTF
jgi:hypothetical protein